MEITLGTLLIALLTGAVPTFLWLFIWLQEDHSHPEPGWLVSMSFIAGAAGVLLILPFQRWLLGLIPLESTSFITIVAIGEELVKFGLIYFVALRSKYIDEAIDPAVYLIAGALGFAALENTLFLLEPIANQQMTVALITSNLRFFGATLLHALSSAVIGLYIAKSRMIHGRLLLSAVIPGFALGALLHLGFNLAIIKSSNSGVWLAMIGLWVAGIAVAYWFEQVKRLDKKYHDNL